MYETFFGLNERPFDLTPDVRYLVATPIHREAIGNLEYGIMSRKGITLLVGQAGTGKTTAIRAAIERQPERTHYVHLHNPALTRDEFVHMLAAKFTLSEAAGRSKSELLLELEVLLRRRRDAQESTVLIVDEAQSLPAALLDEIRLLTNIEEGSEKLLPVIIAGQPQIAIRLNDPSFSQLKQRIALRCFLRPLTMEESIGYVARRILAAGGEPARLFTREAVLLLTEFALGIPRTINVLADNALLGGFAAGQRPVQTQMVREICRDFEIAVPAPVRREAPAPMAPMSGPVLTRAEQDALDFDLPLVH